MEFNSSEIPLPPQGAFRQPDGTVEWCVWVPKRNAVSLVLCEGTRRAEHAMQRDDWGYFRYRAAGITEGQRYFYRIPGVEIELPDPVSRWQPEGVHRPSAVLFPEQFAWTDRAWRGLAADRLVIYELHVGTFTPAGTFDAAIERLPQLQELGITALELMPIAQFPGTRNWGYDGVHPFAAQNSYGGPHALQRLVDAAHQLGMGVILDVVYNHFGPEGNYFGFFGPYFTPRYHTPWGEALNYDGPDSDPVRKLIVDNACQWIRDFHIDGLRLDAIQMIFDFSAYHVLQQLQDSVQATAAKEGRTAIVIAETDQNDVRLLRSAEVGGYGLDGVWSDDFHHATHALLTREEDGYYEDYGRPEHLAKALSEMFVYDGCYSRYRRRRHGSRAGDLPREKFVVCLQNHDQVGNRARGERLSTLVPVTAHRLAIGLLALTPGVPLLFMGQEYGETNPFPFFCSFGDPHLIEAVSRGRRDEFAHLAFRWLGEIPDPHDPGTFRSAQLSWSWPAGSLQAALRLLHQDILRLRRELPGLRDRQVTSAEWLPAQSDLEHGPGVLVVRRGREPAVLALANFQTLSVPRPRIVPNGYRIILSTEDSHYAGQRTASSDQTQLLPQELQILFAA